MTDLSQEAERLLSDDEDATLSLQNNAKQQQVSKTSLEYATFMTIGLSYLWPWNCFLAASAYFNYRFGEHQWFRDNFSSSMMLVSTVTSTVGSFILAERQRTNYSKRVMVGETTIGVVFVLMAISCLFPSVQATPYFMFLMISAFTAAVGVALAQNGSFAVVNTMSSVYTQAIMVGQAVAGILPPIISIITAFASGAPGVSSGGASAGYFLVATVVAGLAIVLYFMTQQRHRGLGQSHDHDIALGSKTHHSLRVLLSKLFAPSFGIFAGFSLTLIYPVFANNIESVNNIRADLFIPTAYLIWNMGDLVGRIICGYDSVVIRSPNLLIGYSLMRVIFVPAFFLCNIRGHAIINSDLYYLLVQFLFGVTNGHLGSSAFMTSPDYVDEDQKEATGGFMTLVLSIGLGAGSLLSFVVVAII